MSIMKKIVLNIENTRSGVPFFQCPECGENLFPEDLEVFSRCPYCDFDFSDRDAEIKDFLAVAAERLQNRKNHSVSSRH